MFKKNCSKCKKKIEKEYNLCPYCGFSQESEYDKEDYGILGKNDFINEKSLDIGSSFMEKIFDNAFKMAEKIIEKQMKNLPEMKKEFSEPKIQNFHGPGNLDIQFFVNGKRVFPEKRQIRKTEQPKKTRAISEKNKEKFAKLPREEPLSKIKRIDGKIVYELEVPGVEKIEDVFINLLENSIEIKAISEKKIYSKTLNMKLPILGYGLKEGNLIIEMQGK
jgi:HSP20 family molecular chaperone IbpA